MLHKGFIQHATGTRHIFSDEHLLFRATFELPRGQESISEKKKLSGLNSNSIHASKEDDRIHTEAEYMASCSGNNEEDDDPFLRGVIDPNTRYCLIDDWPNDPTLCTTYLCAGYLF